MEPSQGLRGTDWAYFAALGAGTVSVAALLAGSMSVALGFAALGGAGWLVMRSRSRGTPGPMPHSLRWTLFLPRGPLSPRHLVALLEPRPGERVLEVGPGVGIYSLPVASALRPDGTLDALDIQPEMLENLTRRAQRAGVDNVEPLLGDAQDLPFPDASFDASFLVFVLGEVPDAGKLLGQLRRVLKPGGRLVIGEAFVDPDFVSLDSLRRQAEAAGLTFERSAGPRFSYLALFSREDT